MIPNKARRTVVFRAELCLTEWNMLTLLDEETRNKIYAHRKQEWEKLKSNTENKTLIIRGEKITITAKEMLECFEALYVRDGDVVKPKYKR